MAKRVICLVVLCLFVLSNTAFATNWIMVKSSNSLGWKLSEYVDADTAQLKDGILTFWYVFKIVKPLGASQRVYKVEYVAAQKQYRFLETYEFVNGVQKQSHLKPSKYNDESGINEPLAVARKHAKESNQIGSVPTPP